MGIPLQGLSSFMMPKILKFKWGYGITPIGGDKYRFCSVH